MPAFPDTLKFPGQTVIDSLELRYAKIAKLTTFICITTVNNDFVYPKNESDFDDLTYPLQNCSLHRRVITILAI